MEKVKELLEQTRKLKQQAADLHRKFEELAEQFSVFRSVFRDHSKADANGTTRNGL